MLMPVNKPQLCGICLASHTSMGGELVLCMQQTGSAGHAASRHAADSLHCNMHRYRGVCFQIADLGTRSMLWYDYGRRETMASRSREARPWSPYTSACRLPGSGQSQHAVA